MLAHLHAEGVSVEALQELMGTIPYTPGMQQLLDHLTEQQASSQGTLRPLR